MQKKQQGHQTSAPIVIEAQIEHHENNPRSLIDLNMEGNSPKDLMPNDEDEKLSRQKWVDFDEIKAESLDQRFDRLSVRNAPLKILNQLPENNEFLKFGAFACSPTADFGTSPMDTPRFGSSLTSSVLMSPVGSFSSSDAS